MTKRDGALGREIMELKRERKRKIKNIENKINKSLDFFLNEKEMFAENGTKEWCKESELRKNERVKVKESSKNVEITGGNEIEPKNVSEVGIKPKNELEERERSVKIYL